MARSATRQRKCTAPGSEAYKYDGCSRRWWPSMSKGLIAVAVLLAVATTLSGCMPSTASVRELRGISADVTLSEYHMQSVASQLERDIAVYTALLQAHVAPAHSQGEQQEELRGSLDLLTSLLSVQLSLHDLLRILEANNERHEGEPVRPSSHQVSSTVFAIRIAQRADALLWDCVEKDLLGAVQSLRNLSHASTDVVLETGVTVALERWLRIAVHGIATGLVLPEVQLAIGGSLHTDDDIVEHQLTKAWARGVDYYTELANNAEVIFRGLQQGAPLCHVALEKMKLHRPGQRILNSSATMASRLSQNWLTMCDVWSASAVAVETRLAVLYEELIAMSPAHGPLRLHYAAILALLPAVGTSAEDKGRQYGSAQTSNWLRRELFTEAAKRSHLDSLHYELLYLCERAQLKKSRSHAFDVQRIAKILEAIPNCRTLRRPFSAAEERDWMSVFGLPRRPDWLTHAQSRRLVDGIVAYVASSDPGTARLIETAWAGCL